MNYEITNESIQAIVSGLNLHLDDKVLAICGAGDSVFAASEFSDKIVGIDNNENQLEYTKKRIEFLQKNDLTRFLKLGFFYSDRYQFDLSPYTCHLINLRNNYFNKERCQKISNRLQNGVDLSLIKGDVFENNFPKESFNKIYLSNCLTYLVRDKDFIYSNLKKISSLVIKGGLIYVSDYHKISREFSETEKFLASLNLKIHPKMSQKAREFQSKYNELSQGGGIYWFPAVFKKA